MLSGSTLAAMNSVIMGDQTWRDAGTDTAELFLRAGGLSAAEARRVSRCELPSLPSAQRTTTETDQARKAMSILKIEDIAHVRFSAPDLDAMKAFLVEFGLAPVPSDDGVLYARGAGPAPFLHATSQGEPGFVALGLRAESVGDLKWLAEAEGAELEPLRSPGGGYVVALTDPNGFRVEVVAGQSRAETLALPASLLTTQPIRRHACARLSDWKRGLRMSQGSVTRFWK